VADGDVTQSYLGGRNISDTLFDEVQQLASDHHVVFEQYQTSMLGIPAVRLRSMTAYFMLEPHHIPWYKVSTVISPTLFPSSPPFTNLSSPNLLNSSAPVTSARHTYISSLLLRASMHFPLPLPSIPS